MENKVPSVYSAFSAHQTSPASIDFDDNSGCDIKAILESVVRNLEELCLKISVRPRSGSELPPKYHKAMTIEFELKKEYPYYFLLRRTEKSSAGSRTEQIDDLVHRLRILQEFYNLLLDTVSFTIDNLKSMYDPKLYDIIITKRAAEVAPIQEKTATEEDEPKGPTNEDPILQEKTERDQQGSSSTQVELTKEDPILQEQSELDEPASESESVQIKIKIEGPILQQKTKHEEPKLMLDPAPQDDASINKKKDDTEETTNEQLPLNQPKKRKLSYLQPKADKKQDTKEYPMSVDELPNMLIIGPNGTTIKQKDYKELQWKAAPGATRWLCDLIFGDDVLATHSLTGNQSPAFRGRERPLKKPLDPLKTADITHLICSKFNVSQQLVRSTITTKCADAAKKLKRLSSKTM